MSTESQSRVRLKPGTTVGIRLKPDSRFWIRLMSMSRQLGAWLVVIVLAGACATRVPPPTPTTLAHPEFLYPRVPSALASAPGASRVDFGWRYLQVDDLKNAEIEFGVALKLGPRLHPARTGQGYVAMVMRDYARALAAFDAALQIDGTYVPALVGRGQALLAGDQTELALAAFEKALALDPSLTELNRRVEVLRFRNVQDVIDAARAAAKAGRLDDARRAYERALSTSPDSAFLHRELGQVERRAGNGDRALERLRRAIELDPADATALVEIGELLEARGDDSGAEDAYRKATAIDSSLNLSARIAAAAERSRESQLPAEFRTALTSSQLTRGDLAAIIGVRLEALIRRAPARQVVMTDTQGHWAARWITETASAGIIEPFENHTFQPRTLVRRGDLATVVSRLLALIASSNPSMRERLSQRPTIADVPPRHLQYDAVVSVVAVGVMPRLEGDRFQVSRQVSGGEAVEVIDRVRVLATSTPGASRP
jgi:tetratricopeptide (TPR) repeat protein